MCWKIQCFNLNLNLNLLWLCAEEREKGAAKGDEGTAGAGPGSGWILGKIQRESGTEYSPGNGHIPKAAPGWGCWDVCAGLGVGLDPCEPFPLRIFHNSMSAPGTRRFQAHLSGSLAFPHPRSP